MTLEAMKKRLAEIVSRLEDLNAIEDLSDEVVAEINEASAEFESLQSKIEAKERAAAVVVANAGQGRKAPAANATPNVQVLPPQSAGFKNLGEFLSAVKDASHGKFHKNFQNTMFEKNGEDGGYLVPETMLTEVQTKLQSDESLFAKTRQFVVSGNSLTLPTNETSPWNGGVTTYWIDEGAQYTESKTKLGRASWKLAKLGALVKVTDELLEDAVALESYMKAAAPEAIMHAVNSAIISGDGVGKPMGILNSGFKVQVAKESGQAADTIVAKNIIKMFSKMIPSARAGAAWYINAGCEEQLRMMKDDLGNFIYLAPGSQMNQSPYGMLLGLPVISMIGSLPQLGDEGDIILANLSYYYTITKQAGLKQAVSSHLYFDRDIQTYKFTLRIDGSCPFKTPVTTEFGNHQMSAIVTLAARA